ncbi:MAG: hypothetical protein BGP13_14355 [Sphingobacteriales bacterium 40-81]|nr:MAG: hypothetical protein BGP13_14355 [Sphingobacteriales bacterium 40-81]
MSKFFHIKFTFVHNIWKLLQPFGKEQQREPFTEYMVRIRNDKRFDHIPSEVFEQWIYPHHGNEYTCRNYGWLDYRFVLIERQSWSTDQLMGIHIFSEYRLSFTGRDWPLKEISALEEDEEWWKKNGTWRVPPIIIDVNKFMMDAPQSAELTGPFQLVEGHTRYRNFRILMSNNEFVAPSHEVFVITTNNSDQSNQCKGY